MKKIESVELKQICVNILREFDSICDENNLRYTICGGTLIGAIRHNGFIPWDDDIDVSMPREDYEKLLKIKCEGKYKILSFSTTKGYYYPFAKMIDDSTLLIEKSSVGRPIGVYIDIFPVDYLDTKDVSKTVFENKKRYNKVLFFCSKHPSKKVRYIQNIFQCILWWEKKKVLSKFMKFIHACSSNDGRYSFDFSNPTYGEKEFFKYRIFDDDYIELNFENLHVKCVKNYDRMLKQVYGDYMKLPPKDKQVSHHNFDAYWKDDGVYE